MKILLVMVAILFATGGCGTFQSYDDLEALQTVCEAEKSYDHPDCQAITDKLIAIEDRRAKIRAYKEQKSAMERNCQIHKMFLVCIDQTGRSPRELTRCSCASNIEDIFF